MFSGYSKEIFRPKWNPDFQWVHCVARLIEEAGGALPYLNAPLWFKRKYLPYAVEASTGVCHVSCEP